jgi:hypothetical protein
MTPMPPVLDQHTFAIRTDELGMLVYGRIPVDFFSDITALAKKKYGDALVIDAGISDAVGATLAIVDPENASRWMDKLGIGPNQSDWLRSCDTGNSSKTIYSVLAGLPGVLPSGGPSLPRDSSDFGRCMRLVERFPPYRDRLGEVVVKYPKWKSIVDRWDELTTSYRAGDHDQVDDIIERCIANG